MHFVLLLCFACVIFSVGAIVKSRNNRINTEMYIVDSLLEAKKNGKMCNKSVDDGINKMVEKRLISKKTIIKLNKRIS